MFAPSFDFALFVTLAQLPLQVGLPGLEPGPIGFAARAVLSLVVLAVVCWILLRVSRAVWRRVAERVRYDERDRE